MELRRAVCTCVPLKPGAAPPTWARRVVLPEAEVYQRPLPHPRPLLQALRARRRRGGAAD